MGMLFKSKKEREREARKERRRALRQAEKAELDVQDRIKGMEKEAAKHWESAKTARQSGEKAAAQRHLTSYRASQVLMTKLEQKRWVFKQYLTKMEAAGSDQEFASALSAVNKVTEINPEMVEDVFDSASDLLGEQQDADQFWGQLYNREMDGAEGALEDHVPSMENLEQQLDSEAAGTVQSEGAANLDKDLKSRIDEGREQVKKLLDEE